MKKLAEQFKKKEHEQEHGAGTYEAGDVDDLYSLDNKKEAIVGRGSIPTRARCCG